MEDRRHVFVLVVAARRRVRGGAPLEQMFGAVALREGCDGALRARRRPLCGRFFFLGPEEQGVLRVVAGADETERGGAVVHVHGGVSVGHVVRVGGHVRPRVVRRIHLPRVGDDNANGDTADGVAVVTTAAPAAPRGRLFGGGVGEGVRDTDDPRKNLGGGVGGPVRLLVVRRVLLPHVCDGVFVGTAVAAAGPRGHACGGGARAGAAGGAAQTAHRRDEA